MLECIEEESSAELASKAFHWIIHAKRSLNLDELVEALALNENDRRLNRNATFADPWDLLRICSSLVYADSSDDHDLKEASRGGEIKFCHYTVEVWFRPRASTC
jgi:hypothetical protein